MINGKYHEEYDRYGEHIVVDLAEIEGQYEVMALVYCEKADENGDEIDSYTTDDFPVAERVFKSMCEKFGAPELKGKYLKLRDDIGRAKDSGEIAIILDPDDGGTCNFDSPTIYLPGWNKKKVIQAAREAGVSAWEWKSYTEKRFVLAVGNVGQGNARTRYAEAMCESLKAAGYDTGMYYQMD